MLDLKDEFASLMDWTYQTARGQCFCCALVDVPIVRDVFMRFPPQEYSGVPDIVINRSIVQCLILSSTVHRHV
jgi:hypothetical protein